MSDTIDSSFGKLSLAEEELPRRSRLSQPNSRLSQTSQRSSALSRPKASLDQFFEDPESPQQPSVSQQQQQQQQQQQGILYNRDAAREETRKVESMENEIFNLKLKITLLEKNSKLNADSKLLYQQLTSAHADRRSLELENARLKADIENEAKRTENLEFKLAEQEEMLTTFLEAQDEYSRICDGVIEAFKEPDFAEYARPIEDGDQIDDSQVDGKLAVIRNIVVNLLSSLQDAQENYAEVETVIRDYVEEKEQNQQVYMAQRAILDDLVETLGGSDEQIHDQVYDLLANNNALEKQLQEHVNQEIALEQQIDDLRAKIPLDVHADLEEVRLENAKLMDAIAKASARSYDITRQFFRRLTAYMGPEWGEENDRRLRHIMEESKRRSRSKLPLLVELMMQCVDELAMMARGAELLPQENADLAEKVRYLEDMLTQELTRLGADKVLLAKYKDLEERLKSETEKRKNEYIGYQRSLTNLSLQ